jgi:P pilus assembly chaperone PapD
MRYALLFAALAAALLPSSAQAELVLSQLVVELHPGKVSRQDIEVWNNDTERAYVAVEPRQIVQPGQPAEKRMEDPDPEKLGLLVSPVRMVLEPGQRKLLRFADILPPSERERVYRVTVKPVVGALTSNQSGLKVLVGYDALVLVRPAKPLEGVSAVRTGRKLTWRNDGNISVELTEGKQCDTAGMNCIDLPGKRLYAGASWSVDLKSDAPADYSVRSPLGISKKRL